MDLGRHQWSSPPQSTIHQSFPSWISFSLSFFLRGPSRTPFESFPTPWNPCANLLPPLTDTLAPFVEIFSPFPTLGGSLLSLLQPLSGPSSSFVPLRGYLFSFVVVDPLRGFLFPLSFFLRGPSRTPFESFPTPWSPCADYSFTPLNRYFSAVRGNLFPLPDLGRIPLEPSPTP